MSVIIEMRKKEKFIKNNKEKIKESVWDLDDFKRCLQKGANYELKIDYFNFYIYALIGCWEVFEYTLNSWKENNKLFRMDNTETASIPLAALCRYDFRKRMSMIIPHIPKTLNNKGIMHEILKICIDNDSHDCLEILLEDKYIDLNYKWNETKICLDDIEDSNVINVRGLCYEYKNQQEQYNAA